MTEPILMKGNEALAEAAIQAGCRHYFGYPITPQTEIAAYMAKRMPQVGGVFLQAESEIAAIQMVYGASAAGRSDAVPSAMSEWTSNALPRVVHTLRGKMVANEPGGSAADDEMPPLSANSR